MLEYRPTWEVCIHNSVSMSLVTCSVDQARLLWQGTCVKPRLIRFDIESEASKLIDRHITFTYTIEHTGVGNRRHSLCSNMCWNRGFCKVVQWVDIQNL
jgi:hypothetical protein